MTSYKYDPKSLLKVPADLAASLLSETTASALADQAAWAAFGREVHRKLQSDQFTKAVLTAMLIDSYAPEVAKRLRLFLTPTHEKE